MVSLTVLTLWIFIQGYRLATGQSREAAMGLVVTALSAALIIGLATSMCRLPLIQC
jgi:type IV secretion system protein VirB6